MSLRFILLWLALWLQQFESIAVLPARPPPSVELSDAERDWIAGHAPIRVGLTPAWAPFSYSTARRTAEGIDIDILNLISERTGLKFEIEPTSSWEENITRAEAGQLDMLTGTAHTPEREKAFFFTRPYYRFAAVIVTREGHHEFSHVSLLRGARVAIPRRHVLTRAMAERLPDAKLVLAARQDECFEMVEHKKADVAVVNVFVATHYLNEHPEKKLQIGGVIPEFDFPSRLAVRRDLPLLVGILDKGLGSISQEEIDTISSRHLLFGLQGSHRSALLQRRVMKVLWGAALVGGLVSLWVYFMRKEVMARRLAESRLRETNYSLEVFSRSISHDLKAPLRAIDGFARVLKDDYRAALGRDGQEVLDRIIASASRMDRLLTDVLAYGQASRTEAPLETLSLDKVVHQLVDEFPSEQRKHFHVASGLPNVLGYPTLLAQSIGNLLGNAIKYVPGERTPEIRVHAEQTGALVRLWVDDNGIGISPENQGRIFKLFERVASKGYSGSGIGLAVVAKSVERMGGTCGVESEPGKGSHFWIQLRSARAQDTSH
jgi:signal transduction histidine kinase